jgi:hypothetical protein
LAVHALALQSAEFDLRDVEPTAVLGWKLREKLRETQTINLCACGWASTRRQGVAEFWLPVD